jgi:hypothetical protein
MKLEYREKPKTFAWKRQTEAPAHMCLSENCDLKCNCIYMQLYSAGIEPWSQNYNFIIHSVAQNTCAYDIMRFMFKVHIL